MQVFQYGLWLLVLIGVMILVHELGHFIAARWFNVRVEVFSFGFGPRLFGFRQGETDFRFSLILFGGYVKMAGEQVTDENKDDPRAFLAKPRWQRLLIALAGPTMNAILAVAILTGIFMVEFPKPPSSSEEGMIGYVAPNSPAAAAGIREGDRIVTLDGKQNPTWEDITIQEMSNANHPLHARIRRGGQEFWVSVTPKMDDKTGLGAAGWQGQGEVQVAGLSVGMPAEKLGLRKGDILLKANGQALRSQHGLHTVIAAGAGKPVEIEYQRDGQNRSVTIQPVLTPPEKDQAGRWVIGVFLQPRIVMVQLPFPEALRESVQQNLKNATLLFQFLRGIAERRMSTKSLAGPIGIAQMASDAAHEGAFPFLALMAVVSLQLAVFNLLPIPILDGGVMLLLVLEMLMRRDLSLRLKETVLKLGFVFLMAVMVFVLYNDISKILPG